MKLEAAKVFQHYSDSAHVRASEYSGRGMFGRTTTAVEFESESDMYVALANIMQDADEEQREEVAEALVGLRKDSMGFGIVIY